MRSFNPPGLGSQEKPPGEGGFQPEPGKRSLGYLGKHKRVRHAGSKEDSPGRGGGKTLREAGAGRDGWGRGLGEAGCAFILCKLITLGVHLTHSVLVGYHPEHLPCFSHCLLRFARVISLPPPTPDSCACHEVSPGNGTGGVRCGEGLRLEKGVPLFSVGLGPEHSGRGDPGQ